MSYKRHVSGLFICLMGLLFLCPPASLAEQMPEEAAAGEELTTWWVRSSPSIEEISGGELKVGDIITKENVHLVKEYFSPMWIKETMDGAIWEINPTTPGHRIVPPDLIKATKRNLGMGVQDENGTMSTKGGGPWIGGFPFPEPKTALEVMGNRLYRNADTKYAFDGRSYWVDNKGTTFKNTVLSVMQLNLTSRVCQDPKPSIPGYEDQYNRDLILFSDPYDVRGLAILTMISVDQTKLPETWGYLPILRRVVRFSTAQRYDSADGSDVRAGDIDLFSDPLSYWDFELVGRRFMFSGIAGGPQLPGGFPLTQDLPAAQDGPGLINGKYPDNARIELRDYYIVEAIPKDTGHLYGKKILYIDSATWWSTLGEFEDKQGELYISNDFRFERGGPEDVLCGNYLFLSWIANLNHQQNTGTLFLLSGGPAKSNYWINPRPGFGEFGFTADDFSLKSIMTYTR